MRTRRQLTLHLDDPIVKGLEAEALRRGLTLSRVANDLLRRLLIEETHDKIADTIKARLDRLDQRDQARARDLALIKETLLLYVRTWMEFGGWSDPDDPDAHADAEERFEGFLRLLAGEG